MVFSSEWSVCMSCSFCRESRYPHLTLNIARIFLYHNYTQTHTFTSPRISNKRCTITPLFSRHLRPEPLLRRAPTRHLRQKPKTPPTLPIILRLIKCIPPAHTITHAVLAGLYARAVAHVVRRAQVDARVERSYYGAHGVADPAHARVRVVAEFAEVLRRRRACSDAVERVVRRRAVAEDGRRGAD
jgi:hypothetical protein